MNEYFIYYSSFNIVGAIVFGIMLMHDCLNIDRQEKQLKYDNALFSFLLYFISDAVWAGVDSGVFPVNTFTVVITNLSNFILMTAITYTWLRYVMAVQQIEKRDDKAVRISLVIPFAVSLAILSGIFFAAPDLLIDENFKNRPLFDAFLVSVPYIYVIAEVVISVKKARREDNPRLRRKHLYIGFFPIMVVAGGMMQMFLMPSLPIFCFAGTILMIIFFIQSIEAQISTDPLTKLNNRGQLMRYVSQENNLWMEGRKTFVVMMDINDFKKINDNYGHAEGDHALVMLSRTMIDIVRKINDPIFLGRFGGDEFIMIAHLAEEKELDDIIADIRSALTERCVKEEKPYIISVGVGYDEMKKEQDAFHKCMQRADEKLYADKELQKQSGKREGNR